MARLCTKQDFVVPGYIEKKTNMWLSWQPGVQLQASWHVGVDVSSFAQLYLKNSR